MPAAKKKPASAAEDMPAEAPVALNAREERVAALTAAVADIASYAYALHGDAAAGQFRDSFWQTGTNATMVLARFDPLWVIIVDTVPPSDATLAQLVTLCRSAIALLKKAEQLPSTRRCMEALAASATALDQVAAMLDGAARG